MSEEQSNIPRLPSGAALQYLGNGPTATALAGTAASSHGQGWQMSAELYAKCTHCGYTMCLHPKEDETCFCGKLSKDAGKGRFGSTMGDSAIEIYRLAL